MNQIYISRKLLTWKDPMIADHTLFQLVVSLQVVGQDQSQQTPFDILSNKIFNFLLVKFVVAFTVCWT